MPKLLTVPEFRNAIKKKLTRGEQFLMDMDAVVRWDRIMAQKGGCGNLNRRDEWIFRATAA